MALADYSPVLQWYADALTDLDQPTGCSKSNPGSLADPSILGTGDQYAEFRVETPQAVSFEPPAPVNNAGTGGITIVMKGRFDSTTAGRIVAENWDGSGANDSDVGWQIVNTTGTSRRIGLALPPTAYTAERLETSANAITHDQDFIVAFRRSGTTWTVWLDDDATGGMVSHTPGTNNLPGDANFTSCGRITFGSDRNGSTTFDGFIYWLVAFDTALSDADLQLAAWDDEANLKAAWLSAGGEASASDTLTLSDSAVSATEHVSDASDTIATSDSAVSAAERVSAAADTLTLSDSAVGEVTSESAAVAEDALTFTDSALSVTERVRVAADSLTLTEEAISTTERVSAAADTITLSDSAVGEATSSAVSEASDTVTLSDSAVSITERVSTATDTLTLTDSASSFAALIADASDAITVSDSAVGGAVTAVFADADDSVTFSDASLAELLYAGVGEDSLALSDSAVSFTERVSVAIDALALNDEAQSYTERLAAALDAIGFSDSATAANASSFVDLAYIEFALRARRVEFSLRSQLTGLN